MTPMKALFHRATTRPNGTAFIYDDVVWTYHDLLTGAEQGSGEVAPWRSAGRPGCAPHAEHAGNGACGVRMFSHRGDRVPDKPALQDR